MITLTASYFANSTFGGDTSTLSTPSFTPANGEVIVVKATTWDTGTPSGTPSGGGLTYTQRQESAPGGFTGYATVFTATVSGSPGSMAVTLSAPGSSCHHAMVVERWSGATLAATPATIDTIHGVGPGNVFSTTITTTGTNSIVTWANYDNDSRDTTGRAYFSGATEDGISDGHLVSAGVMYFAYQSAASPGSQTVGMSAPTSQNWTVAGIEVLEAATVSRGAFLQFF